MRILSLLRYDFHREYLDIPEIRAILVHKDRNVQYYKAVSSCFISFTLKPEEDVSCLKFAAADDFLAPYSTFNFHCMELTENNRTQWICSWFTVFHHPHFSLWAKKA